MAQSFAAQISEWVREAKARQLAVLQTGAERVIEMMQTTTGAGGNMPVRDGFLRASLQASLGGANFVLRQKPAGDAKYNYNPGAVALVIQSATINDTITVGFTANYASYVNDGAKGRPPRRFVELAAQMWPRIIAEACREAERRSAG
jgi:hypothetical protein